MGSRAIIIVCREQGGRRASDSGSSKTEDGICYTRTGRRFFEDLALERELLATVRGALDRSGFWEQFNTNWVCLDCELMPWSAKALELVRQQYASVGTAARVGLGETVACTRAGRGARNRCRRAARPSQGPSGSRRAVRAGVSALLLAGRIASRHPRRTVPRDGDRRRGARGQGSRLAHEHDRGLRAGRRRAADAHAVPRRRPCGFQQRGRGDGLVGRADGGWRRRRCRQADAVRGDRFSRPSAARGEVPRSGVSADHLRPGVHVARNTSSACGNGASQASDRWLCESSRWASKDSNGSSRRSPSDACTSAFSASWRWRANRSIRAFRKTCVTPR